MAVLESCPKHNMVAYLEKTKGNAEFHEVIDFLARSSIHHALTVSPVVSTTFVEQFWMSAKSKIINNVRYITAKVAGKPVSISEASIRRKITPLFATMLVPSTEDEDASSERPSKLQPTPSPPHPSEANVKPQSDPSPRPSPTPHIPDHIPSGFGGKGIIGGQSSSDKSLSGNEGDMTLQSVYDLCISLCTQVSDQAKEIQHLKEQIKKLKKQAKPGRKSAKGEPSVHKDPLFDEMDYMETEDAQDVGRTRDVVNEEKENADAEVSTEDVLSTAQQKVSTDKEKVSTDRPKVSTDGSKVSTDKEKDSTDRTDEGTDDQTEGRRATQTIQTTTSTMFGDDETIAQVLLNMSQAKAVSREKEKGVEFKDVEETERPRPTSTRSLLTLKPLPKIDPKDKGKKKIEEEDESETESEEEERKRLAEEEATNDALIRNYDDIKARIEADRLLAERLQEEEREKFTHSHLKTKKFEEIQALYEKIKRSDEDFIAIGSAEVNDATKLALSTEREIYFSHDARSNRPSALRLGKSKTKQSDDDSDDEHRKCLKIVTFEATIDSEIMEKKSVITRLDKVSSPDGVYLVIHRANGNFRAFNYLIEVLHIFDRQDLFHLYELMMEQYSEITLEGYELILWGDLKIMIESSTKENYQSDFWSNQQEWKIITWRLYEACGVCILELEDGIVIHMLVERSYPLSKELLQRMLDLGLEVERESIVALDLIRFIKKQIDEE
ncbi:hypothetical protein Tco_0874202 [Tanacetum coccineum]|uniref:Uncharacterized protein n=1 Tax=Tanacetum coccineum TaxID=301880 RepID=A0ABQ5BP35_9ASTR